MDKESLTSEFYHLHVPHPPVPPAVQPPPIQTWRPFEASSELPQNQPGSNLDRADDFADFADPAYYDEQGYTPGNYYGPR